MKLSKSADDCPLCGGKKKEGQTTFTVDLGFGVVVVRNVPARVCSQCGADWIQDPIAAKLEEIVKEEVAQEEQAQTSQASDIPDYRTDRENVRQASEQLFRSLFRAGMHVAMAPVYALPEESREHFFAAGREFTRGLSTLAQEIADDFDKLVSRDNGEAEE